MKQKKKYLPKFQNFGASFSFVFRKDSRDESDKSQFSHRVSISVCLSVWWTFPRGIFLRPRISNFLNCKKILGKSDGPKWISNFVKKTVLLYNLWWFGYYCLLVSLHREGSAYRAEGLVVAAALQYTTPHFIVLYVYTASLHWTVLHYCAVLTVLYFSILKWTVLY